MILLQLELSEEYQEIIPVIKDGYFLLTFSERLLGKQKKYLYVSTIENHLSGSKSYESSWYNATLERAIEFKPEIVLLMSLGASRKTNTMGTFLFVVVVVVGPILFCMVRS